MLTTPSLRSRPFLSVLVDLVGPRPASTPGRSGAGAAQRRGEEALDRMSPHLRDDLGHRFGEGCVTDWGLLEAAMRVRRGWS